MIICDVSGSAYNCSAEYMVDNNKATFFLILFFLKDLMMSPDRSFALSFPLLLSCKKLLVVWLWLWLFFVLKKTIFLVSHCSVYVS